MFLSQQIIVNKLVDRVHNHASLQGGLSKNFLAYYKLLRGTRFSIHNWVFWLPLVNFWIFFPTFPPNAYLEPSRLFIIPNIF